MTFTIAVPRISLVAKLYIVTIRLVGGRTIPGFDAPKALFCDRKSHKAYFKLMSGLPATCSMPVHIMENKLSICPLGSNNNDSVGWGMCHLPELHVGQVTLVNWPCYREQHTEVQLLGLPLAKGKAVIAGLVALRRFRCIVCNSVRKEVESSLEKAFEPRQLDSWSQHPFAIEEDLGGNAFLLVRIPIAGEGIELQRDTSSGRGLAIAEELWERMHEKTQTVKLRKSRDLYPYIGWLARKRGVVPGLEVGDRIVRNPKISVFPNDSPIVDQCSGLVGMQYFRDTMMVLDFERNIMWVKGA